MGIATLQSPPEAFDLIQSGLDARIAGKLVEGLASGEAFEASQGIPLFTLGAEGLASDDQLGAARQTGWRHVLASASGPWIADIASADAPGGARLRELVSGDAASNLVAALHVAERAAADGDYRLRILDVPACDMAALWLSGPAERFVPLLDATGDGVVGEADFVARARTVAARRREAAHFWESGGLG